MAKTPEEMEATMVANLKDKTGKAMSQWLKLVRATKLEKHGEIVKHLKSEHGVTHGFANLITHHALREKTGPVPTSDGLVEAQYGGGKEALRPIYDAIVKAVGSFGSDVEIAPKKTYVSLRRNKQFGLVQPSTKTRVDVGLCLKGTKPGGRLEAAGSFNAMVSHRVKLAGKSEVDQELIGWLRAAYDKG